MIASRGRASTSEGILTVLNPLLKAIDGVEILELEFYRETILHEYSSGELIRGRSISLVAATSLYTACRFSELPISIGEIATTLWVFPVHR